MYANEAYRGYRNQMAKAFPNAVTESEAKTLNFDYTAQAKNFDQNEGNC